MINQKLQNFEEEVKPIGDIMTQATIELYQGVVSKFLPTPTKIHYLFNLRDISKVMWSLWPDNKFILKLDIGTTNTAYQVSSSLRTGFVLYGKAQVCQCFTLPITFQNSVSWHYDNTPVNFNAIFHGSMNSIFKQKFVMFFLIHMYVPNMDCGCLLEPLHWGSFNKYPQSMYVEKKVRVIMLLLLQNPVLPVQSGV